MKQILTGVVLILASVVAFNWWDTAVSSTSINEAQTSLFLYIVPYVLSFILGLIGVSTITNGIRFNKKEQSNFEETA